MRTWIWIFFMVSLGLPALAQEVAGPSQSVLLCMEFGCKIQHGDKETKRLARPMVMTASGKQAEIRMGGLNLETTDEKFDFAVAATPTVQGQRIRMKLSLTVQRQSGGPLRQGCTLTADSGEAVEFSLEGPEGGEEYTLQVIPILLGPDQEYKGRDQDGKPIIGTRAKRS